MFVWAPVTPEQARPWWNAAGRMAGQPEEMKQAAFRGGGVGSKEASGPSLI